MHHPPIHRAASCVIIAVTLTVLMAYASTPVHVHAADVNPPVAIAVRTTENQKITGRVTSYDQNGFSYTNILDKTRKHKWTDFNPQTDYLIHNKLLPKDDAKAWFKLGHRLLKRDGGKRYGNEALDKATRLDSNLSEAAETVKKNPNAEVDLSLPPPTATDSTNSDAEENDAPPIPIFKGNARPWKMLDERRTAGVVEKLKVAADTYAKKLNIKFQHTESNRFLIYSDLPVAQLSKYGTLLDRVDRELNSLYQLKHNTHVWYGKASVFIFDKRETYEAFEKKVYFTTKVTSNTSLHRQGDGSVIIACHRKADDAFFDDALVRIATQGYLYRYISNLRLAAWIDVGLAGHVAKQLVTRGPTVAETKRTAIATELGKHGNKLGSTFFTARTLESWQQDAAIALVTHMIQRNRKNFSAFLTAVKAGYTWQVSLEEFYDQPEADLLKDWGNAIGIRGVMR